MLYFREDSKFKFEQKEVQDTYMIEKKDSKVSRAWKLFHALVKDFAGYKSIPKGGIILGFGRDIVLDPFKQLQDDEKPEKGKKIIKPWVTQVATAQCYKAQKEAHTMLSINRQIAIEGVVAGILLIPLLVAALT